MNSFVVTGDAPEILHELKNPHVMGVVWTGAWSEASLAFARRLADDPAYNPRGGIPVPLSRAIADSGQNDAGAQALRTDLDRCVDLLLGLGAALFGKNNPLLDFGYLQPAVQDPEWELHGHFHPDIRRFSFTSALAEMATCEYLDRKIPGYFCNGIFRPTDPDEAEANAVSIPLNSLIGFKCVEYPFDDPQEKGLLHRRPAAKLALNRDRARPLVHFNI